jgi:type IV fimbrial biogenesis protein FimT
MNTPNIPYNKGFTLIELLSVVAIMAITLAFGLPSFRATIADNRLSTSANDMVVALQLARSESIKQVIIAGVSIPSGGGSQWEVFKSISGVPANILQKYTAASGVRVDAISTGATDETPTYRSDGRLTSVTPIIFRFTLTGNTATRTLTIAPSGRVSVTNP